MVGKAQRSSVAKGSGLNRKFHTSQGVEKAGWNWSKKSLRRVRPLIYSSRPIAPPENSVAFKVSLPAGDQAFKAQLNGEHFRLRSDKEDQR